jgi:drug/metabolite transporter (DMT)-like permease
MAAGVCLTGLIFSLPMAISQSTTFDWQSLSASNVTVMIYYAAMVWALPYAFFFMGVTKIPASASGMAIAVIPLAASFFAIAFFGEKIRITDCIALALVTLSIFAAEATDTKLISVTPTQSGTKA